MDKMKEVKLDIQNGDAFYADEVGIMHNPMKMIMDFRSITPRMDIRAREYNPLVLKHNVVMMDIYMAKNFFELLGKNINNYEKRFGKIEKPEALKKYEDMNSKTKKTKAKKEMPTYFG